MRGQISEEVPVAFIGCNDTVEPSGIGCLAISYISAADTQVFCAETSRFLHERHRIGLVGLLADAYSEQLAPPRIESRPCNAWDRERKGTILLSVLKDQKGIKVHRESPVDFWLFVKM